MRAVREYESCSSGGARTRVKIKPRHAPSHIYIRVPFARFERLDLLEVELNSGTTVAVQLCSPRLTLGPGKSKIEGDYVQNM